jgi:hypothetical protein
MMLHLRGKYVTIAMDGWTTNNTKYYTILLLCKGILVEEDRGAGRKERN